MKKLVCEGHSVQISLDYAPAMFEVAKSGFATPFRSDQTLFFLTGPEMISYDVMQIFLASFGRYHLHSDHCVKGCTTLHITHDESRMPSSNPRIF